MRRAIRLAFVALVTTACVSGSVEQGKSGEEPASSRPEQTTRAPADTSTVTGSAPAVRSGFDSVVVLEPVSGEQPALPAATVAPAIMDQIGSAFAPAVILARVGQPVEFRNSEDVIHNVRAASVGSGATAFNVATVPFGSYHHTFEAAGAYSLTCDIHLAMAAYVYVTTSPYAAIVQPDGAFSLDGVPFGAYTLTLWNVVEDLRVERRVEIREAQQRLTFAPDR